MEINVNKKDLLKEVKTYAGDVPFLIEIIDNCTLNWDEYEKVLLHMITEISVDGVGLSDEAIDIIKENISKPLSE